MGEKTIDRSNGNLIPASERSKEEHREIARAGGIKSGQVRRAKKKARELIREVFAMDLSKEDEIMLSAQGIDPSLIENKLQLFSIIAAYQASSNGNVKALRDLMEMAGIDVSPVKGGFDPTNPNNRRVVNLIPQAIEVKNEE